MSTKVPEAGRVIVANWFGSVISWFFMAADGMQQLLKAAKTAGV